jgi:hypothetical protein
MTTIIGLIGFKQSGKSTAAKHLEEKYGFVRHNFKDALVAEIKQNFPDLLREIAFREGLYHWEDSLTETGIFIPYIDQLFDEKPPLVRALMQNYGTEVRRKENPNYWVNQWLYWAEDNYNKNIVTDDVRFLNEAKAIKDLDGITIRIIRTDITTGGDHPTETEQLEIEADYTIEVGPGEHEKLYEELDKILK